MEDNTERGLRIVTLEELKTQMRVDFEEEDAIIELYGKAAEDVIVSKTRRSVQELCIMEYADITDAAPEEELDVKVWFPARLKLAMLVFAAHCYRNREPVAAIAQNAVPYSIEVLVKPYVRLTEREV